jgi:hypothetical protein
MIATSGKSQNWEKKKKTCFWVNVVLLPPTKKTKMHIYAHKIIIIIKNK